MSDEEVYAFMNMSVEEKREAFVNMSSEEKDEFLKAALLFEMKVMKRKKWREQRRVHHKDQNEALLQDVAQQIPEQWRQQFITFMQTSEASQEFMDWLDTNETALNLCDKVIDSDGFMNEIFSKELWGDESPFSEE